MSSLASGSCDIKDNLPVGKREISLQLQRRKSLGLILTMYLGKLEKVLMES